MKIVHRWIISSLFFAAPILISAPLHAAKYVIDPSHSSVEFRVSHMTVGKVRGHFEKFEGGFTHDENDPKVWAASAAIETSSIDTGNADRDKHLRSADFFDADKHPSITFKSTEVTEVSGNKFKLHGLLNMHGVEKPVTLDAEFGGVTQDPYGNTRAGFEANGKVNRKDFGIIWNKTFGNGGLVVGEDVDLRIAVEGVAAKSEEQGKEKIKQQNKLEKKPAGKQ